MPSQTVLDSASLRTWEIAGASHVPAYSTGTGPTDFLTTLGAIQTCEFGLTTRFDCVHSGPSRVESGAVFHAAYDALDKWVRDGTAPRRAQPLATVDPRQPAILARDADGIALGGIRDVEVPTGLNDGINAAANLDNPLSSLCVL